MILSVITTFFKSLFVRLIRTAQAATVRDVGFFPHFPMISFSESGLSGFILTDFESGVKSSRLFTFVLILIVSLSCTSSLFNFVSKCKCPLKLYFPFAFSLNVTRTVPPPVVADVAVGDIVASATLLPTSSVRANVSGFVTAVVKSSSFGIAISK